MISNQIPAKLFLRGGENVTHEYIDLIDRDLSDDSKQALYLREGAKVYDVVNLNVVCDVEINDILGLPTYEK